MIRAKIPSLLVGSTHIKKDAKAYLRAIVIKTIFLPTRSARYPNIKEPITLDIDDAITTAYDAIKLVFRSNPGMKMEIYDRLYRIYQ